MLQHRVYALLALVPLCIAVTLQAFQRELVKGGMSVEQFSNVESVLYLLAFLVLALSLLDYHKHISKPKRKRR